MKIYQKLIAVSAIFALFALSSCGSNSATSTNTATTTTTTDATTSTASADSKTYVSKAGDEVTFIQVAATIVPDINYSITESNQDLATIADTLKTQKTDIEKSLATLKTIKAPTDASMGAYVSLVNNFIGETDEYLKIAADVQAALTAKDSAKSAESGKLLMDQYLKLSDTSSKIDDETAKLPK